MSSSPGIPMWLRFPLASRSLLTPRRATMNVSSRGKIESSMADRLVPEVPPGKAADSKAQKLPQASGLQRVPSGARFGAAGLDRFRRILQDSPATLELLDSDAPARKIERRG